LQRIKFNYTNAGYYLGQNEPNPFSDETIIDYSIPSTMNVKIDLYNSLGEKVAVLLNEQKTNGTYQIIFKNNKLSKGVYYYVMETNDRCLFKKMILTK
jgi:hypothetical protein